MTTKRANAEVNLGAADFTIPDEAMAQLSALRAAKRRLVSPAGLAPAWDD